MITSKLSERPFEFADLITERGKILNPEYSICRDQPTTGVSPLRINVLLSSGGLKLIDRLRGVILAIVNYWPFAQIFNERDKGYIEPKPKHGERSVLRPIVAFSMPCLKLALKYRVMSMLQ